MQTVRERAPAVDLEDSPATSAANWWPSVLALILAVLFFGIQSRGALFLPINLSYLVDQTVIIGMIALGAGLVLLVGEIDLSVGVVSFVCGDLMAVVSVRNGVPALPAILLALAVGLGLGTVHGLLVVVARLPSAYVTLMAAFLEAVFLGLVANSFLPQVALRVSDQGILGLDSQRLDIFGSGLSIPVSAIVLVALVLLLGYVLRRTSVGRRVYAIGQAPAGVRRDGSNALRIGAFVLAATFAAAGGMLDVARQASATAFFDQSRLLFALGAPVIGGISLFGGRGSVWGVLLGALICGTMLAGGAITNQSSPVEQVIEGVALIAAVSIAVVGDVLIRRRNGLPVG